MESDEEGNSSPKAPNSLSDLIGIEGKDWGGMSSEGSTPDKHSPQKSSVNSDPKIEKPNNVMHCEQPQNKDQAVQLKLQNEVKDPQGNAQEGVDDLPSQKQEEHSPEEPITVAQTEEKAEQQPEQQTQQKPEQQPQQQPAEEPASEIASEMAQKPAQKPAQEPVQKVEQKPAQEPAQKPEQKVEQKLEQKPEQKPEQKVEQKPECEFSSPNSESQPHNDHLSPSFEEPLGKVEQFDHTITIHQPLNNSKNSLQKSINEVCLQNFVSTNDSTYKGHVKTLKKFYGSLKHYSKESLNDMKVYEHFLKAKLVQEKELLEILQDDEEKKIIESLQQNEVHNYVYTDSKMLIGEVIKNRNKREVYIGEFCAEIEITFKTLNKFFNKIEKNRKNKQEAIETVWIQRLAQTSSEIEDLIQVIQRKKAVNSEMKQKIKHWKDRYLAMKYVMQREKQYLQLMESFALQIISFLNQIFLKEQIVMCTQIKEAMLRYSDAYFACYGSYDASLEEVFEQLENYKAEGELKTEMAQTLLSLLPEELSPLFEGGIEALEGNKIEVLVDRLNSEFQNIIFLPTVEMPDDFILFQATAKWKQIGQEPVDGSIVLTPDRYLHIQIADKMATISCDEMKITKKGRDIILLNKGKGLVGYLIAANHELGRIEFFNGKESDDFTEKLKSM